MVLVVITLDKEGLIYWSLKVAVEKGINKIGEGHGIVYMQIINDKNKLLGSVGKVKENFNNDGFQLSRIF